MRRFLIIDGNYFAMRALGQINMGDNVNNLETDKEQREFLHTMNSGLLNLIQTFNNSKHNWIDHVIFVSDYNSWRKKVEPFCPYYVKDNRIITYKGQRQEKKDESPINYDNFYSIYNQFVDGLEQFGITVFKSEGFEGDDLIALLSIELKDQDVTSICFCTDGDLQQIVRDNFVLFRNICSKEAPNGEFVFTQKKYEELFEVQEIQSASDAFLNTAGLIDNSEKSYWKKVTSLMLGDIEGTANVPRKFHQGIDIAYSFKVLLEKAICGDKKDRLFSILGWPASTGTREYWLTEKYLEKGFTACGITFTNANCFKVLSDEKNTKKLIAELIKITKQSDLVNTEQVYSHFS